MKDNDFARHVPPSRPKKPRKLVTALSVAGALAVAAAGCGSTTSSTAASTSTGATKSSTSSAASFFKGKTITLIVPDNPGGTYDLYGRLLAPYLGKELGATVVVENVSGAGGIVGANKLAASTPNGLTIGNIGPGGAIGNVIEKQPGQQFNITKFNWIGQPGTPPNALLVSKSAPYKTFKQLQAAKSPVGMVDIKSGQSDLLSRVVLTAFGIPHKFLTGYADFAAVEQGYIRGDAPMIQESLTSLQAIMRSGKSVAVAVSAPVTNPPKLASLVTGVPTYTQLETQTGLSGAKKAAVDEAVTLANLSYDFAAPPGLSASKLAVLRKAFMAACNLPALKAAAAKGGLPISPIGGATIASSVKQGLSKAQTLSSYLG